MGGLCGKPSPLEQHTPEEVSSSSRRYKGELPPSILPTLKGTSCAGDEDGDRIEALPPMQRRARRTPLARRAAAVPPPRERLSDPSDSASTLTRADAAHLAAQMRAARGQEPAPLATPSRSPGLRELFPTLKEGTPRKLADIFGEKTP